MKYPHGATPKPHSGNLLDQLWRNWGDVVGSRFRRPLSKALPDPL